MFPSEKIPEKNVDLEKLGLINQDLFPVDGALAQRYNTVLKNVFDFECDLDSFRIDKRGLSPEIAEHLKQKYPDRLEFGENYLNIQSANRFMVILSPDQKSAPLVAPQTSYENDVFDEVFRQARHTIEDITSDEAMFGELDNGITVFRSSEDLIQLRTIEVYMDTLNNTVRDYFELRKLSDNLGEGNNALDENYISKMQEFVKKIGDTRNRNISKVFPVTKEVHCFYVEFFKGVHCLRNLKRGKIKSIFISHHQDKLRNFGEDVLRLDLHDKNLPDILEGYDFTKYDDLVRQRMVEIEDEFLLSQNIDVVSLPEWARTRKVTEVYTKLPKVWHELRDIDAILPTEKSKFEAIMEEASYEAKIKLSQAKSKDEIVYHMLAEIDPTDPTRMYLFNRRKLITEFKSLPLNRQRYIAYTLLNQPGGK